jgi:hypothetical protein
LGKDFDASNTALIQPGSGGPLQQGWRGGGYSPASVTAAMARQQQTFCLENILGEFFFFFSFCGPWDGTQDLVNARQVIHH